jgi:hypothetical protein
MQHLADLSNAIQQKNSNLSIDNVTTPLLFSSLFPPMPVVPLTPAKIECVTRLICLVAVAVSLE